MIRLSSIFILLFLSMSATAQYGPVSWVALQEKNAQAKAQSLKSLKVRVCKPNGKSTHRVKKQENYDSTGHLIYSIDHWYPKFSYFDEHFYTYNTDGHLIEHTKKCSFEKGVIHVFKYFYNEDENVAMVLYDSGLPNELEFDTTYMFYSVAGKVQKKVVHTHDKRIDTSYCHYDRFGYVEYSNVPGDSIAYRGTTDSNGCRRVYGDSTILLHVDSSDSQCRPLTQKLEWCIEKKLFLLYYVRNQYDADHLREKETYHYELYFPRFGKSGGISKLLKRVVTEYDSKGAPIKETIYSSGGKVREILRYEYENY